MIHLYEQIEGPMSFAFLKFLISDDLSLDRDLTGELILDAYAEVVGEKLLDAEKARLDRDTAIQVTKLVDFSVEEFGPIKDAVKLYVKISKG